MTKSPEIFTGAQEAADVLSISVHTLTKYAAKYPPGGNGFLTHLQNRWSGEVKDLLAWWRHVRIQEQRHPEARMMRPQEAPAIAEIQGRVKKNIKARSEE